MRLIDADKLMDRLESKFFAHDLKTDFDRCARSVILSCMEAVLRSPTIAPNDPLTLEQLREMDGEPVWVQGIDDGRKSRWAFVDAGCELVRFFTTRSGVVCEGIARYFKAYGETWIAYRRKPEADP